MSKVIRVLGIDPSMNNFGYALANVNTETSEIIYTGIKLVSPPKASKKKSVRQNSIDLELSQYHFKELQKFVKLADMVCVEIPVGSQTARAMASYGICVGLLASLVDKPMIQVTPLEVKLNSVGTKTATKREMINWAFSQNNSLNWLTRTENGDNILIDKNEHMADAMAAIKAGVSTNEFKTLLLSKT